MIDEAPDTDTGILKARANLEASKDIELKPVKWVFVGNSKDAYDLHGAISTSREGRETMSEHRSYWNTNDVNGICLYFNPYDSPAIHEPDLEYRRLLEKHLPTIKKINQYIQEYDSTTPHSPKSTEFWRMCMGFWKAGTEQNLIISPQLIHEAKAEDSIVFTGMVNLEKYAGLDPAFSQGGDNCVLRIVQKGHITNGQIVADFRENEFLYYIRIEASATKSANIQIAEQVLKILGEHRIPLSRLAIEATG